MRGVGRRPLTLQEVLDGPQYTDAPDDDGNCRAQCGNYRDGAACRSADKEGYWTRGEGDDHTVCPPCRSTDVQSNPDDSPASNAELPSGEPVGDSKVRGAKYFPAARAAYHGVFTFFLGSWWRWLNESWEWNDPKMVRSSMGHKLGELYHGSADLLTSQSISGLFGPCDALFRLGTDEGEAAVLADQGATIDVDTGEKLEGVRWADGTMVNVTDKGEVVTTRNDDPKRVWCRRPPVPHAWGDGEVGDIAPFDEYLASLELSDDEVFMLKAAMGRTICEGMEDDMVVYLYGRGGNGKSTLLSIVAAICGAACHKAQLTDLCGRYDLGPVENARVVAVADLQKFEKRSKDMRAAVARIKSIAGGDKMPIERKYQAPYDAELKTTLWMAGNDPPAWADGSTETSWARRMVYIKFHKQFKEEEEGKTTDLRLISTPGLMQSVARYLVHFWADYVKNGYQRPQSILDKAREAANSGLSSLERWISEHLIAEEDWETPYADLLESYRLHVANEPGKCDEIPRGDLTRMTQACEAKPFQRNKARWYRGIKIRQPVSPPVAGDRPGGEESPPRNEDVSPPSVSPPSPGDDGAVKPGSYGDAGQWQPDRLSGNPGFQAAMAKHNTPVEGKGAPDEAF
ncbi:MAG: DUF5906 domain-containing protein [Chloroflexota bacterium]|nr:DUF5906 domain-containing protein [Chloroflexota bacterium]